MRGTGVFIVDGHRARRLINEIVNEISDCPVGGTFDEASKTLYRRPAIDIIV